MSAPRYRRLLRASNGLFAFVLLTVVFFSASVLAQPQKLGDLDTDGQMLRTWPLAIGHRSFAEGVAPPGTKLNFLSFDHTTGRLVIEGTATVTEDGMFVLTTNGTIQSDSGVGIRALTARSGQNSRLELCAAASFRSRLSRDSKKAKPTNETKS